MEKRTMRKKPAMFKRMLVSVLSLVMLLSVVAPGLAVGAEESVEVPAATELTEQMTALQERVEALSADSETFAADYAQLEQDIADLDMAIAEAYAAGEIADAVYAYLSDTSVKLKEALVAKQPVVLTVADEPAAAAETVVTTAATETTVVIEETTASAETTTATTVATEDTEETTVATEATEETTVSTEASEETTVSTEATEETTVSTEETVEVVTPSEGSASNEPKGATYTVAIEQGSSGTVSVSDLGTYDQERIRKDGNTVTDTCGITYTKNTDTDTVTINVSETTEPGEYTIQFRDSWAFGYYNVHEITITVTEKQSTGDDDSNTTTPPVVETKQMTYDKKAFSNGDGTYNLELTLSGAAGSQTQKAQVDILFIVDTSGSMKYGMDSKNNASSGNRRIDYVSSAISSLISTISSNSDKIDARYSLVQFDGPSSTTGYGNQSRDASVLQNWTSSGTAITTALNNASVVNGTNYEAGIEQGKSQLNSSRSGAQKVVIFLTDGLPTAANNMQYNDDRNTTFMNEANNSVKTLSCNQFYCIGAGPDFSAGETGLTNLNSLINNVGTGSGATVPTVKQYYGATNTTALNNAFAEITANTISFLCENVTITDTMSNVGGELIVKVTDPSTVKVSVYRNYKGDGTDVPILGPAATVTLNSAGETATASYNAETGVMTLDFTDSYKLEADLTYMLSAVIEPTETAYEQYRANGNEYADRADANTGTHSGELGVYANQGATVSYTYKGEAGSVSYPKPVIQLDPGKLIISKKIENMDSANLPDLKFPVTITYPGSDAQSTEIPFAAFTDSDADGIYTFEIEGLSPNTSYSVTESGYEVDGYNVSTTITGADTLNGIVASGTVAKGATETVAIVNTYAVANTSVTINKTVTGNMGDVNKAFSFTVTLDKACDDAGKTIAAADGSVAYTVSADGMTITFSLKHNEQVVLQNIPIGATMSIKESGVSAYAVSINGTSVKALNATDEEATLSGIVVAKDMEAIPVVNDNEASIDTGITLDSMPFIFLFLTSAAAALLMLTKRRYTGKF